MRTALVLRHVAYEGLGAFAAPIEAAGYRIRHHDMPAGAIEEAVIAADLVIAMGGPMGVYEEAAYPWLRDEVRWLQQRIACAAPTVGICLGSQLIAAALGARVYPGSAKEVGFAAVALTQAGVASPLRHLAKVPVLHWHGDTFDLPPDVELLASTSLYANQAFARGDHLLALQCHPEMGDDPAFARWLDGAEAYVAAAGTTPDALRRAYARLGPAAARAGAAMIGEWLARLA